MTIGSMLSDIVKSLFSKPATERYPFQRNVEPERLRGKLIYDPTQCAGCQLCVKDCPADALELLVVDKVNKRFVLRYDIDHCSYCSQCVQSCRFNCLEMSHEQWELASTKKQPFDVYYGREEDIQVILARFAPTDRDEA
jgi:formate hydrogenlyase subunit 6/NADH:ubiquinone oxidoreductase subunit I